MGVKHTQSPTRHFSRDEFVVFDDFNYEVSGDLWTVDEGDAASTVAWGGPGSNVVLTVSVADESAWLASANGVFKFIDSKAITWEARLKHVDVNTDDGNVAFGLCDAVADDVPITAADAVAIPNAGAIIYKLKDEVVWSFQTEIGTAAVVTASTASCLNGAFETYRVDIIPISTTVFQARPFIDDKQLVASNGKPIQHDITLGTATDMELFVMLEGAHANDQVTTVDYLYCSQVR